MKTSLLILFSVLSGLLLFASWPVDGFTPLIFIALVPLLLVQQYLGDNNKKGVFWYSWLAFLIWNVLTTWWIWNSTPMGAIMAFVLNSLFISIVFLLYHHSKKALFNNKKGAFILLIYWITWEFLHMNWDLTWSWLNLGNVFATKHTWIQWYEYTGSLGGTLWVLTVNIIVFEIVRCIQLKISSIRIASLIITTIIIIVVPLIISFSIYNGYKEKEIPVEVVVVQPNIDPYNDQYSMPFSKIMDINLDLASKLATPTTNYIVFPESAIQEEIWEGYLDKSTSIRNINLELLKYSNASLVTGATTYRTLSDEETPTNAARSFNNTGGKYYAFNTAFLIEKQSGVQIHHKSKLTPGVEIMPSWWLLKPFERFAIDLGGTTGTLGREENSVAFFSNKNEPVSPIICYESVYGEFVANSVKLGSGLIFVITNDGWWGNTPGYKQHLMFSVLRSIETRRSVARAANTGVSAFINQRGDIIDQTDYWVPAVIKATLNANYKMTYYTINGDYIARGATFISSLLILISFTQGFLRKRKSLV